MLNLARLTRSAVDRARKVVEFMSHPSFARDPLPDHEQKQAALGYLNEAGRKPPRWRRWRLPRASQPVRGVRRTGRHLRRGRGGEIRGRPGGPRPQRRILDDAGEAVIAPIVPDAMRHPSCRSTKPGPTDAGTITPGSTAQRFAGRRAAPRPGNERNRFQRLQKPHRLARRWRYQFALPHHPPPGESADRPSRHLTPS